MNTNIDYLKAELLDSRKDKEQVEVILSNLIKLRLQGADNFSIPHDDVLITIQAAIALLKK